jgi:hypothetical protein
MRDAMTKAEHARLMARRSTVLQQACAVAQRRAHLRRSLTRVYDRYSYDAEKRIALETWARRLQAIIDQQQPGKFLPFGASAIAPERA